MSRLTLITLHTPTKENVRGASALPFHILSQRPDNLDVRILSYNINNISPAEMNEVEQALSVSIEVLKPDFRSRLLRSRLFSWIRVLRSLPTLNALNLSNDKSAEIAGSSDYIWIYGEDIGHLANKFNATHRCVVTTPDCEALYYARVLHHPGRLGGLISILRYGKAYSQYLNVARMLPVRNTVYHLVGQMDAEYLRKINSGIEAVFIPHPHYDGNTDRNIRFSRPRLRLLVSGRYDFYCKDGVDEAVQTLLDSPELARYYHITFQGRDWDGVADKLLKAGYEVDNIGMVPVYKDELCRHDILLSSITLGTGTKGKVLDAFINGLLVIGTERSVENIMVKDSEDFFFYRDSQRLNEILSYIPHNIEECERIAIHGRASVLREHNIIKVAREFYGLFSDGHVADQF